MKVLSQDWSDYEHWKRSQTLNKNWPEEDERRQKLTNPDFFACTEAWETIYLVGKIYTVYPELSPDKILNAIEQCCNIIGSPHNRREVVEFVVKQLSLR